MGAKNKNKKRQELIVFLWTPEKKARKVKNGGWFLIFFYFSGVFLGGTCKNDQFLAFFVFVFCSHKERPNDTSDIHIRYLLQKVKNKKPIKKLISNDLSRLPRDRKSVV